MVDSREGDIDHLERGAALDDLGGVGVVGDHDHIGVSAASGQLVDIGGFGIEVGKAMSRGRKRRRKFFDPCGGDTERFKQCDVHRGLSSCGV